MQKLLYIPFPSMLAGGLAKGLEWSERIQVGMAKPKAEKGEYRGFKYSDRLFAPPKSGDKYVVPSPQRMTTFLAEEDFIYVNAHCNRGIGTLSLDEKCESKQKVTPEDLVAQLVAHGLPATSRSRMKLWACHAGLDAGAGKPSFAELFSTAMFGAGYETLRIFAYTESLMAQYDTVDEDHKPVNAHKHANARESQEEKLRKVIAAMKSPNAATTVPKLPMKQAVWGQIVKAAANDEERALRDLLNDGVKVQIFVGAEKAELATVGARASKFRREFRNGVVVGHGKATSG